MKEAAVEVVQSHFSMLTSTSPNSLLLASLEATTAQFITGEGIKMIEMAVDGATRIKQCVQNKYMGNYIIIQYVKIFLLIFRRRKLWSTHFAR
jgi:arginine/lysine/ornithine decarboxylase